MKKPIIPIVLLCLFSCNEKKIAASAVPEPVKTAFTARYPGSSDVEWEQEKENGKQIYEAEFKLNGKEIEAEFDSTGSFIREE